MSNPERTAGTRAELLAAAADAVLGFSTGLHSYAYVRYDVSHKLSTVAYVMGAYNFGLLTSPLWANCGHALVKTAAGLVSVSFRSRSRLGWCGNTGDAVHRRFCGPSRMGSTHWLVAELQCDRSGRGIDAGRGMG